MFVLGCDADPANAGRCLADEFALVPPCATSGSVGEDNRDLVVGEFRRAVRRLCRDHRIDFVFPTMDFELDIWVGMQAELAAQGTIVFVNPAAALHLASDKVATAEWCRRHSIAIPQTWPSFEDLPPHRPGGSAELLPFPLVAKPARGGFGSTGVRVLRDRLELEAHHRTHPTNMLYQEHVEGTEFTVDVLCHGAAKVVAVVPKERLLVRDGQAVKAATRRDVGVMAFAATVARLAGITVTCNVQLMRRADDGDLVLIEINAKFATSLPLTVQAGINIPLLLIGMSIDDESPQRRQRPAQRQGDSDPSRDSRAQPFPRFKDGLTMVRCWQEHYLVADGEGGRAEPLEPFPAAPGAPAGTAGPARSARPVMNPTAALPSSRWHSLGPVVVASLAAGIAIGAAGIATAARRRS